MSGPRDSDTTATDQFRMLSVSDLENAMGPLPNLSDRAMSPRERARIRGLSNLFAGVHPEGVR